MVLDEECARQAVRMFLPEDEPKADTNSHPNKIIRWMNLSNTTRVSTEWVLLKLKRVPTVSKTVIVITKKIAPKAVDRNRIKRIISEALRDRIGKIEGELVLIVKKNIAHFKKQEASLIIGELLKKLK
ncbi:hypothetical protein A2165_00330 [Candidatus Curtissbacteria bacterium RBG_13_40_7]|uniref:Uncharacterized protein n=1 Tax=Candidatus Curtissbacteria bacterium RBG_13_40_7 TaxID=1797706 RepID=A0A1F5FWJ7_9BACT|nr:MAG: hypothetical protein A2165_00330 [Candidatus Curtissbacteria bacterium RBG_13_40_7]